MMVIEFLTTIVKSTPCENSLADFCTSALLKALNIADGQAFSTAEL